MLTSDAAEALGLTPHTVRVQINNGKLRARKIGRDYWIEPREVERYRSASLGKRRPTVDHLPGPTAELVTRAENVAGVRPEAPRFCPAPKPSQRRPTRTR